MEPTTSPEGYASLATELERRIQTTRAKAALAVNRKVVLLYWSIGRDILMRQRMEGWDGDAMDRLAADLRRTFPGMTGLSARNLGYKRAFAEAWPDLQFVQRVLVLLPWGHNTRLLDSLETREQREWYAHQAIQRGWSRSVLAHQIESDLFAVQGGGLAPPFRGQPAAELPRQIIEDPHSLDILSPGAELPGAE
jgi:predicted nuclease of restriction endonuclease-like (RecB) superfamily